MGKGLSDNVHLQNSEEDSDVALGNLNRGCNWYSNVYAERASKRNALMTQNKETSIYT